MTKHGRTRLSCVALACLSLVCSTALAQDYPKTAVKVIVPLAAGGPTDVVARLVADGLTTSLKQPFVVENRTGAGGAIGTEAVARAKPDGYTLGVTGTGSMTVIPFLDPNLSYNPARDLTIVAMLASPDLMIVAHPAFKPGNMKELIEYARAKPDELAYATPGTGTPAHLDMENLANLAGIKMIHVPFAGDAPAVTSIIGGNVNIGLISVSAAGGLIKDGKLKAIASGGPARSSEFPNVPTVAEQTEYKDYVATSFSALVAPINTPPEIVDKLNETVNATLKRSDVRDKLQALGMSVLSGDAKSANSYVAKDGQTRKRVIDLIGMKRQ